jgi:hypothetical protein
MQCFFVFDLPLQIVCATFQNLTGDCSWNGEGMIRRKENGVRVREEERGRGRESREREEECKRERGERV